MRAGFIFVASLEPLPRLGWGKAAEPFQVMSLSEPHKSRLAGFWTATRERVVTDFRDFRFTWRGFWRWTGIVVSAVLVAAVVTLYFLDWNQLCGPIGRYLSGKY